MQLFPRKSLFVMLFHEWIGIKLFNVVYTRFAPFTCEKHHGANHGGHSGGVAYSLCAGFLVGGFMTAIVVYSMSLRYRF